MSFRKLLIGALAAVSLLVPTAAQADLKLSQLIVELGQGSKASDIELWNDSPERTFVSIEPREIVAAGTVAQSDRRDPDPQKLGLLASPSRVILEPGQRRLLRVASLNPPGERERVYRVTVKPVAGALQSSASGIKIMVGYDILVLVRPERATISLVSARQNGQVTVRNDGNSSVELIDGQQCDAQRKSCSAISGKRLYAGASWTVPVLPDKTAEFTLKTPSGEERRVF
jgi:P pilus assembly chaperone PapD